jgi:hypothetical protein
MISKAINPDRFSKTCQGYFKKKNSENQHQTLTVYLSKPSTHEVFSTIHEVFPTYLHNVLVLLIIYA